MASSMPQAIMKFFNVAVRLSTASIVSYVHCSVASTKFKGMLVSRR